MIFVFGKHNKIKRVDETDFTRVFVPESTEVDLDSLNGISKGGAAGFCACRYRSEKGSHVFEYSRNNAETVDSRQFGDDDAKMLATSLRQAVLTATRMNFNLDNIQTDPVCIFRGGDGYRFIYVPFACGDVKNDANRFISDFIKKYKKKHELFKQILKELKQSSDVMAVLERYAGSAKETAAKVISQSPAYDSEGETTVLSQSPSYDSEGETTVLSQSPSYDSEGETTVLSQSPAYDSEGETTVLSQSPSYDSEGETTVLSQSHSYDSEGETTVLSQSPSYDSEGETTVLSQSPSYDSEGETTVLSQSSSYDSEGETTVLSQSPAYDSEGETTVLSQSPSYDSEGETTVLSQNHSYDSEGETTVLNGASGMGTQYFDREELSSMIRQSYSEDRKNKQPDALKTNPVRNTTTQTQRVILVSADNRGQYEITGAGTDIGSADGSGMITLRNSSVSRRHAGIIIEDGHVYVIDYGSTNGTYVDGVEIEPQQKTEIYNGSFLSFGNESFQLTVKRV